jgi:hypothetical protein
MSVEIKFESQKVDRALRRLIKRAPEAAAQALRVEAELVMTDSKQNYVPVDLGTLRASGHVNEPEIKGKNISCVLSFGGAASPYALAVHEHPSASSPPSWQGKTIGDIDWSPAGRGPKYLEKPLRAAIPKLPARVGERIKRDLT